jgi:glutathione synthase/RimK-type ligase-like ATP-grasp enzyme
LADIDTVWWRRPYQPAEPSDVDEQTKTFVRGEWEQFIDGLEAFTSVRWVNQPTAHRLACRKPGQLVAAQAEGLRVPRTRITNDPETVRHFAAQGFPLIYKRIGTSPEPLAATKPFLDSDLDRLQVLRNCPAIFQERIDARCDIRVTAIGPDLHAAEIDSQRGASPLDWRFDHTVAFRPHALDLTVSARLAAMVRRLGLLYAAIDLRLTPEGEYVFLEVNPGGQFLFIELLANMPLSEYMAAFLASNHATDTQRSRTKQDVDEHS